ncbi:MAG: pyridoxamine 5'-phosphate oxidase family protein [Planctomycetota bacterium]|jgi:uncharacterized pyridoxamine 5'-phosphate oxidase family protein
MRAADAMKDFHEAAKIAFLATCDGDLPRVRPMSPVAVEGNVIWVASGASSEKMAQIAANPNVELCYMKADHSHLRIRGKAEVCDDPDVKQRIWEAYPLLKDYFKSPDDPEFALLKITAGEVLTMPSMSYKYERLEL